MSLRKLSLPLLLGLAVVLPTPLSAAMDAVSADSGSGTQLEAGRNGRDRDDDKKHDNQKHDNQKHDNQKHDDKRKNRDRDRHDNDSDCVAVKVLVGPVCIDIL